MTDDDRLETLRRYVIHHTLAGLTEQRGEPSDDIANYFRKLDATPSRHRSTITTYEQRSQHLQEWQRLLTSTSWSITNVSVFCPPPEPLRGHAAFAANRVAPPPPPPPTNDYWTSRGFKPASGGSTSVFGGGSNRHAAAVTPKAEPNYYWTLRVNVPWCPSLCGSAHQRTYVVADHLAGTLQWRCSHEQHEPNKYKDTRHQAPDLHKFLEQFWAGELINARAAAHRSTLE